MEPAGTEATRTSVWALVVFTGFVFGSGGLLSKSLIDGGVDPVTVTALPFLAGGLLAWLVAWRNGDLRMGALGAGATLGVVSSALPALCFNLGFETLPAGLVTLIVSLSPVITAVVASLVFADERFNPKKGLGLVLAFAGVAALIAAPGVIEGTSYRGAAWATTGALLAGTSAVLARWYALGHGALALIAPQLTAAGFTSAVIGLLVGRSLVPDGGFAGGDIAIMIGIGLIASYGGFRAIMLANERGTTGQVAMVAYLIPLVGVVGGIIFFDETLTLWILVGAALIVAGITVGGRASAPMAPPPSNSAL
ncbi:MAG: DMT family transporter [Actinomycetia bacterium]|nr:DMT family transporter [Actinomycetes bacterium]MCP4962079.1 DMT family transporter [Actinomycetes bacterium]